MKHFNYTVSFVIVVTLALVLIGCAKPPEAEKSAAKAAMDAAITAGAGKYAVIDFDTAKNLWDTTEVKMKEKKYDEAKQGYVSAKAAFEKAAAAAAIAAAEAAEPYRTLTPEDGLSCSFSQDLSMSMSSPVSGNIAATRDHFDCVNKDGKEKSIELESTGMVDGKVGIKTKDFGTILRGNEEGTFDKYEMKGSQIKKLRAFLGFQK